MTSADVRTKFGTPPSGGPHSPKGGSLPRGSASPRAVIMEDLDVFYFKQLTNSLEDEELQQKIDHEIRMRDGTAKLLAASKQPAQMLEAAKGLMASNARMIAYMSELQRRKTDEAHGRRRSTDGNQLPCKARVAVSDLRIPLMWKDTDHFKNKGDHRRYVVFCLLKIGTEIYDTSLIKEVDRSMTDITFEDCIVFNNIPSDFVCRLEVYCHKLCEDLTIASTHKKMKKRIEKLSGSIGKSVGRRLSGLHDADILSNMIVGPKYDLLGHATMRLSDVSDSVNTFDLTLEDSPESSTELPLFGHYCCRVAAQPYCLLEDTAAGFLYVKMDGLEEDKVVGWDRKWCVLKNLSISCWDCQEDEEWRVPVVAIPVTKNSQMSEADPSTMTRPHSFLVNAFESRQRKEYTLAAESKDDLQKWWDGLQQHLLDQVVWKDACNFLMKIKPSNQKRLSLGGQRSTSLYEDTPGTPKLKRKATSKTNSLESKGSEFSPLTMMLKKFTEDDTDKPVTRQRSRDSGISST